MKVLKSVKSFKFLINPGLIIIKIIIGGLCVCLICVVCLVVCRVSGGVACVW